MDALDSGDSDTFRLQSPESEKTANEGGSENIDNKDDNGGGDGTRTRDIQRDRAKFSKVSGILCKLAQVCRLNSVLEHDGKLIHC